jgi:hypothetical protein
VQDEFGFERAARKFEEICTEALDARGSRSR